jgi:hypothetical protein
MDKRTNPTEDYQQDDLVRRDGMAIIDEDSEVDNGFNNKGTFNSIFIHI